MEKYFLFLAFLFYILYLYQNICKQKEAEYHFDSYVLSDFIDNYSRNCKIQMLQY